MKHQTFALAFLLLVIQAALLTAAEEITLKVIDKPPPSPLNPSIAELLQPRAIQILRGEKPVYEFWFRSQLPIRTEANSSEEALKAIKDTTLLGAALVHAADQLDYKDNQVLAGVYTMRFGLQPVDGDHLGSSLFPYFAILIPAQTDIAPDTITRSKQMSKASGKPTATGHPVVLSLRPTPHPPSPDSPSLTEPAEHHEAIQLTLNVKAPEAAPQPIAFELVFTGHGEIQ